MLRKAFYFLAISLVLFCSSCVPESKKILTEVEISLDDPECRNILTHEYMRQTDSLLPYFNSENPTYRFLVAKAAASVQDETMLDSLYGLLDDPSVKVRSIAAYAIGQIGNKDSEEALLNAFRQKDTMSVDNIANAAILEAIGKLGTPTLADLMVQAQGYRDSDTLLMQGKMKSLFHYALRDIHSEKISGFLVEKLKNQQLDPIARLYAAHTLARSKNLDIEKLKFQIAELFVDEVNTNVKMALALALKNTSDPEIQNILISELNSENDYRVKVNIIMALSNYNYIESAQAITEFIKSDNIHLAKAACGFIYTNGVKEDVNYYRQISRDSLPWQVQASLLKAINKILPYYYTKTLNSTRWQIQQLINAETDTLIIGHYLDALSHDPAAYPWIIDYLNENDNPVLVTQGIYTLKNLLADENFNGTFKRYADYHRKKILEFLTEKLSSSDEGILGSIGEAIADENTFLHSFIDSTNMLFEAKYRLLNPNHIESIHALERAIAQVRGVRKPSFTEVVKAKVPNWDELANFTNTTKAIVKTNKGNLSLELYFNTCPSTVMNFLQLSNDNFYDGKVFHRVVPNFVVQTGSPRGDNYGGESYVINSELGPLYYDAEAYIGMASAGPDTESTQWFITHSPTPHLDGKYTIFGKVYDGRDVLHQLQMGDIIEDIIITNL